MPVFIGLLMLFGIAAKNSILLVEFAIEDERAGQTPVGRRCTTPVASGRGRS